MIKNAHEASLKSKQLVAEAKRYVDDLLSDAVIFANNKVAV